MPAAGDNDDGRWLEFDHGRRLVRFWIPALPDTIEAEIVRTGDFYESDQLDFIAALLPRHASIVDVGANIGNHTIHFAAIAQAAKVIAIEPNPDVIPSLRRNVAANDCLQVDLSALGYGASDGSGRGTLVLAEADASIRNRGGMTLQAGADGAVPLRPLDRMVRGPVDLIKIDVEGMAVAVLRGAAQLVAAWRPLVMVEIMDAELEAFGQWQAAAGYGIRNKFPMYAGIDNYLCEPAARWTRLWRSVRWGFRGLRLPRQTPAVASVRADLPRL